MAGSLCSHQRSGNTYALLKGSTLISGRSIGKSNGGAGKGEKDEAEELHVEGCVG